MKRYYIHFNGRFLKEYKSLSAALKFYMDRLAKYGSLAMIRLIDTDGNIIRTNENEFE